MNGMAMMLKSFGVDPAQIMSQVEDFKGAVIDAVNGADERLKNIEAQNASLLISLAEVKVMLQHGRMFTPADASRSDIMRVGHESENHL